MLHSVAIPSALFLSQHYLFCRAIVNLTDLVLHNNVHVFVHIIVDINISVFLLANIDLIIDIRFVLFLC